VKETLFLGTFVEGFFVVYSIYLRRRFTQIYTDLFKFKFDIVDLLICVNQC
jgi:hypothetical protein